MANLPRRIAKPSLRWRRSERLGPGEEMTIEFAVERAGELGIVLLAGDASGIRWVSFGDTEPALCEELLGHHAEATPALESSTVRRQAERLAGYLRGESGELDLPLAPSGSPFQRAVWDELQRIPRGETRTYAEIASALGRPGSTRAVAGACARNTIGLLIPCHRVVRADGALTGFRWGISRKRTLLVWEGAATADLQRTG
jgi:AraC family transcriptional regulator, regulatory protein of adaptative response / methylated-DNA-[protein]-cysteine methyltransferase